MELPELTAPLTAEQVAGIFVEGEGLIGDNTPDAWRAVHDTLAGLIAHHYPHLPYPYDPGEYLDQVNEHADRSAYEGITWGGLLADWLEVHNASDE